MYLHFFFSFVRRRETAAHRPVGVSGDRRIGHGTTAAAAAAAAASPGPQRRSGRSGGSGDRLVVGHGGGKAGRLGRRRPRVQVHVLRQAVRNELEPEDALARAHGREAVRVPAVRGHVQAEGAPAQAPVLGAPERDIAGHQRRGPGLGGRVQLLLLSDDVRHAPAAGPPLFRAAQQPVAHQEPERLTPDPSAARFAVFPSAGDRPLSPSSYRPPLASARRRDKSCSLIYIVS